MTDLRIAPDLVLPPEAVADTFAMLAKRGGGKSNAAVVMAEEMWKAGFPWVALDPKGDWWGIQANATGDGPGLPIPVFGGVHGNLPLEPTAGPLMARLVVEKNLTCVLDLSDFSKGQQVKFALAFAETLWDLIRKDPRALHLFLEEAEEFLPQQVKGQEAPMVGLYSKLAKQGRSFGLGITLITQRSASLSKDALSQTENLILFRTTLPADKATVAGWIDDPEQAREVRGTLAQLEQGESWVISPGLVGAPRRVRWNRRTTFDSGATPLVGQRRRDPVGLAGIDLGDIEVQMKDTIERAEAEDPKRLQARIRELEGDVRRLEADLDQAEAEGEPERVEVPYVPVRLRELLDSIEPMTVALRRAATDLGDDVGNLADAVAEAVAALPEDGAPAELTPAPARPAARAPRRPAPAPPAVPAGPAPDVDFPITGLVRTVLSLAAQHPDGIDKRKLGLLAGKSVGGGHFANTLGRLRTAELITRGWPLRITDAGARAVHGLWEPLPTGEEALDFWCSQFGGLGEKILRAVAERGGWTREEMEERTGTSPGGGHFANTLGKLRTADLVAKGWPLHATDDFLETIR